ncbi:hypothetical protein [Mesonia aquimarina]|uniref:hypothetical protein n=1 Tax=Mesonia aquimarina TaxID=1504967 RepID=UPI000EF62BE5|nr:hypothetical protein [Mesonia aquimarina]
MNSILSIKRDTLDKAFLLFPVILIFISEILHFIFPSIGVAVKFLGLISMVGISILKGKFNTNSLIIFAFLIPVLIYHYFVSFSYKAATEELVRYCFPIVILFYSYTLKDQFKLIFNFFLVFFFINLFAQIVNYILWQKGVVLWFFDTHENGSYTIPSVYGFMRATGVLGFFSLFGFFYLLMFFIIETYYKGRFKVVLLLLSLSGLFASISYKGIVTFLVLIFVFSKKKLQIISGFIFLAAILVFSFPDKALEFYEGALLRTELYISEGNSARAESYRVMANHTGLLGEGLGSFGGPASVDYGSPFYREVNFNWFGLKLGTTDTYFPHLFIEVGLIGALLYILFLMSPLLKKRISVRALRILGIIYFALFFDAAFSYSLNNTGYLMVALIWVFPVIYYSQQNEKA